MFFKKQGGTFDYLVVGLGNPGKEYENTRHNAGFAAVDAMMQKFDFALPKKKFDAIYGECNIGGARVLVAKPQTYMNLSGKAVSALASFYKIPVDRIIVLFDDVSIDVGKIRIRRKGSSGGQKGINNIIDAMGSQDIMRVKIGVGAKPNPDYDMKDWVLGHIPKSQADAFKTAAENAALAVREIIVNGINSAMNKYSK